jgi:spore coat polysaccharide biosynthesis predicted glycosyltransferase SpsG
MFFFRIDLGPEHGLGHYSRVISLIRYLNIKNYKIVIDNISDSFYLEKEKKNIIILYKKKIHFKNEFYDAKLFSQIIKGEKKKSIVVKDSYRLGYKWEKIVKKYSKKLIVIEDNLKKKHFADFYINHSPKFLNINKDDIKNLKIYNKKNCTFLLGPNFSLFNSSFNKNEKVNSNIVFYNGGAGNILVYEKIIKNILKIKKNNFKIILIIGPYAKNYKTIFKKFRNYKNILISYQPKNILKYLIGTKIFVSSAGISIFESSHLRLPTLLFKMNNNQNLSDMDYEKLGHYLSLEKIDLKKTDKIVNLIHLMLENVDQIKNMMSFSNIKLRNVKENYIKNLKNKI